VFDSVRVDDRQFGGDRFCKYMHCRDVDLARRPTGEAKGLRGPGHLR
jgi:hypothetical protein